MELSAKDLALVRALTAGLPISERPYADLGAPLGLSETQVIDRLRAMVDGGMIRRLGVIVRHRELGFRANAMVVWDIPDDRVSDVGRSLAEAEPVTLCYRRPRRSGRWPYNLFCMIHGRDREQVMAQVADLARGLADQHGLSGCDHRLLFSSRRFKQCGARYGIEGAAHGRD